MLSRMVQDYRAGFQNGKRLFIYSLQVILMFGPDFAFMVIQYAPRNLTGLVGYIFKVSI